MGVFGSTATVGFGVWMVRWDMPVTRRARRPVVPQGDYGDANRAFSEAMAIVKERKDSDPLLLVAAHDGRGDVLMKQVRERERVRRPWG